MCKFPKGKAGFKTIRKENYVYIDKTRYIELLENTHEQAILFLRPRRFGKTLFTSMLDSYYDIYSENEFEPLFNIIRQKSPILYRWVMNAIRYVGYRW